MICDIVHVCVHHNCYCVLFLLVAVSLVYLAINSSDILFVFVQWDGCLPSTLGPENWQVCHAVRRTSTECLCNGFLSIRVSILYIQLFLSLWEVCFAPPCLKTVIFKALCMHTHTYVHTHPHTHSYHIATGGGDHIVNIWDIRKGDKIYSIPAHTNLVSHVKFQGNNLTTSHT